jgi:HPt (histidine-containing phosphotransfer) domain-containing protein
MRMMMALIDQTALDCIIDGDAELLADLAIMFVQMWPATDARLRLAVQSSNAKEISMVAHQLYSRFGYFGAKSLQELARKIELSAKENDLTNIAEWHAEVLAGIETLLNELRSMTRLPLEKDDD